MNPRPKSEIRPTLKAVQLVKGTVTHRQHAIMLVCTARCSRGRRFLSETSRRQMVVVRAFRYSSTNMITDSSHASSSVLRGVLAAFASRSRKPISPPEA